MQHSSRNLRVHSLCFLLHLVPSANTSAPNLPRSQRAEDGDDHDIGRSTDFQSLRLLGGLRNGMEEMDVLTLNLKKTENGRDKCDSLPL